MTDTTTAPTPEELAAQTAASLFDGTIITESRLASAIAAAIRQHSAPLEAQIAELTADLDMVQRELAVRTDECVTAEAALSAMTAERDKLREYATATEYWKLEPHDQKERSAFLDRIAALQPKEPANARRD